MKGSNKYFYIVYSIDPIISEAVFPNRRLAERYRKSHICDKCWYYNKPYQCPWYKDFTSIGKNKYTNKSKKHVLKMIKATLCVDE